MPLRALIFKRNAFSYEAQELDPSYALARLYITERRPDGTQYGLTLCIEELLLSQGITKSTNSRLEVYAATLG